MKSKNLKKKNDINYDVFDELSEEWWDEQGSFKALHSFNLIRLNFIQNKIKKNTFKNFKVLDIGCGGGILCEPLARLGANVTGIDTNKKAIQIAKNHALRSKLKINYINTDIMKINERDFDFITCMEVLEHVEEPESIILKSKKLLKRNGLFLGSTINRTISSMIFAVFAAEKIFRLVPEGTHQWKSLIKPSYLKKLFLINDFQNFDKKGVLYNPITNTWSYSYFSKINYLFSATSL